MNGQNNSFNTEGRLGSKPFLTVVLNTAQITKSNIVNRRVLFLENHLKFTDDKVNNRRRFNNASLRLKILYKRVARGSVIA